MKTGFLLKRLIVLEAVLLMVAGTAEAATVWSEAGEGAVATLPDPQRSTFVRSAQLHCAERRWALRLDLEDGAEIESGPRLAALSIGSEKFDLAARQNGRTVSVAVPGSVLPPLRQGLRLEIEIDGAAQALGATFSLIGSRKTIEAITPRCSKPDMSAYRAVNPSELYPETALARRLLEAEIAAFRTATRASPAVRASLIGVGDGRHLLFATLCGSSWYYGNSGCNLTVHARRDDGDDWFRVYETEGMDIHIDPASHGPWPNLVTLTPDGDEITWRWQDQEYLPEPAGEPPTVADESPAGAEELNGG